MPVGSKAVHLPALVAPYFSEDLIWAVQLTAKGNKVVVTRQHCLLLGPSETINAGIIIGQKGKDNIYRLIDGLTIPKKHYALQTQQDVPEKSSETENSWKIASNKMVPESLLWSKKNKGMII